LERGLHGFSIARRIGEVPKDVAKDG
jgi:hypothetical protein